MTRRYVIDPMMNKMRRTAVNEKWLEEFIGTRREMLWEMQGPHVSPMLRQRYMQEEKELFSDKENATTEEDYIPR